MVRIFTRDVRHLVRRSAAAYCGASSAPAAQRGLARRFSSSSHDKVREQASKWRAQDPEDKTKFLSVRVDRSALKQPAAFTPPVSGAETPKSKENELVHILRTMIEVKGPLTVSEFMQRALSHPDHGYYMKKDVFGVKGDFTTAPEISQMFGELIGVWCVATWQQMGMPSAVKIVEMGPGRGSLMSDFLRAAKSFPPFYAALEVHMLEISPALREIQKKTLGCVPIDGETKPHRLQIPDGPVVQWHDDLANVPRGPSLFIAQELFDALPVHQFEYTARGWCERLVDVNYGEGEDHFRFVVSPGPTPATRVYIGREKLFDPASLPSPSQAATAAVPGAEAALPIRRLDVADTGAPVRTAQAQIGDNIEVSPVGIALVQDIAKRVAEHGGGALVVDYGHDHPSELSLRGIKNHEFVSVLREPGDVDLSIDVDFYTLRRFATLEKGVNAYGPVGQGEFLKAMGIEHRLAMLLQNCESEAQQEELFSAYERLVNADQMGTIFKAMALTHTDIGRPVGFESANEMTSSS
ncbi:hypothetical protein P43SY_009274 [Pythium insidiosum]|uniref:Protein arginine methyltransferase NDUFAF7 n=1 Tax=Pythium insidiosum TaxID=114742 RepID=A0AAD5Q9K5_PYTIN|nr:hypothetical protein P43SY_009274 [Pythium insidiosum]